MFIRIDMKMDVVFHNAISYLQLTNYICFLNDLDNGNYERMFEIIIKNNNIKNAIMNESMLHK